MVSLSIFQKFLIRWFQKWSKPPDSTVNRRPMVSVYVMYIHDIIRSSTQPRFYALNSDKGQIQELKQYGAHSYEM